MLNGKETLASRFADIDIQQVREEEKENERRWRKYPKRMCKIFKIPHLPEKMMKIAYNWDYYVSIQPPIVFIEIYHRVSNEDMIEFLGKKMRKG